MDAAEILEKGADYIRENGWTQDNFFGEMVGDKIPACCMGAMISHFSYSPMHEDARKAVAKVMAEQFGFGLLGDNFETIRKGNDLYAKNAAEVIACMEKAAINLREQA